MPLAALLLAPSLAAEPTWRPSYLVDVPLVLVGRGELPAGPLRVPYRYLYEDDVFNFALEEDELARLSEETYAFTLSTLRAAGLPVRDCRPDLDVYIVQATEARINTEPFAAWRRVGGRNIVRLYGFYDPTTDRPRGSVLVYAQADSFRTKQTFVHELAHYWFDRMCLYEQDEIDTETFARTVEAAWRYPF